MTQHTPGPWNLFYDSELDVYQLDDGADVFAQLDLREKDIEANARLIASAPNMLAALEVCLEAIQPYYDSDDDGSLEARASNMALAAINKAKGL